MALHEHMLPSAGGRLTCVSVEDLAAVGEQLKHLDLAAVGGHHDVTVFTQELHIQHLVVVTHKLREGGQRGHRGRAFVSSESVTVNTQLRWPGSPVGHYRIYLE